jgi:transcriptional regulator with XRE-family HTH domain
MDNDSKESALIKLAQRIKELRLTKGVSQQDAYNDTGIHFGRIEQGKRDLSYITLLRICEYFDIELMELFVNRDYTK